MDIIRDSMILGGSRYALLLVDVTTRYSWIYGMPSLSSNHAFAAWEAFRTDAGGIPRIFHSDFDNKLIGGKALKWIQSNDSKVIAAPARRQSYNGGIVEQTWWSIITMAHIFITEKQVGREFW